MGQGNSRNVHYGYFVGEETKGETRRLWSNALRKDEDLVSILYECVDTLKKSFK